MARTKSLTYLNSDRYYNCVLENKNDLTDYTEVTLDNEFSIQENMDRLEKHSRRLPLKDANHYIIYHENTMNDKLIESIIKHGGGVSYYTKTVAPYYVINQLANHMNSEVIYAIRDNFTPKEIQNVELASMATRVIIDCPVTIPETNPYDLLFSLHDLKVSVDKVNLNFPTLDSVTEANKKYYTKGEDNLYHVEPQSRFDYFKYIQTSLSIWKMNIHLILENDTLYEEMDTILNRALDKRNPGRKKKRKEAEALKAGEHIGEE